MDEHMIEIVSLIKIIFLITTLFVATIETKFSLENCASDNQILKFNSIEFNKKPVIIGGNNPIIVSIDVDLSEPLDDQMMVQLSLSKYIGLSWLGFWLPLPCINGFGACDHNLCDLLTNSDNDFGCSFLKSLGRECSCPIEEGHLIVDSFEGKMDMTDAPSALIKFASGEYWIKMVLMKDDKSLGCAEMYADLELVK